MADNSNTTATDQTEAPAKLWATKVECEAAKPTDAPKSLKPMEVKKGGTVAGWINARGYDNALAMVARAEGFTVSTGRAPVTVTKDVVAAKLATFSDAELQALGLTRKPVKGKK